MKKKKNSNRKIFIILFILITIIRFLLSFNLKSFYISNLSYDDNLMVNQMLSLVSGNYLGEYSDVTLIKGIIFPLFLTLCRLLHTNYSLILTILYIGAVIYFIRPFEKIIKNKKLLFLFYIVILFNPITYSSELFQRLYRNSLSIIELLFFLGTLIRIIDTKQIKKNIINYILLGIISSIMYLTREDNIWIKLIFIFLIVYEYLKSKNLKNVIICLIPFIVLTINLNIVSFINYKYYKIYTYNEIQKSEFKNTYKKVLQIKDDEKKDKVSIPRTTFFKLTSYIETFNITRREINQYYKVLIDDTGEIYNGNIIWYFRQFVYRKNNFKDGKESEEYYKKMGQEIDIKFKDRTFGKELAFSSILLNMPTPSEIIHMPINMFKIVEYTTIYKNVKTITNYDNFKYDEEVDAYRVVNLDSHTTENIVKKNNKYYEVIRIIYMIITVVFSPIALIIYIKNIKKKDNYNLITTIILFIYLIILAGVTYTDATAFPTKRYLCLGNLYILQTIFIMLNILKIKNTKLLKR